MDAANVAAPNNSTEQFGKIYVNIPISPSTILPVLLSLVAIGVIAFGGNILVLLFLKTKDRTKSFLKTYSFQTNFNLYIKSLAISDILSSVISIPYVGLQQYSEVLQRGWGCKIGRYLAFVFPCITINNLLVISFGKYFSTRQVPRKFNHSTMKRIVLLAWLAGSLFCLFPAATFDGIRYDLNNTHYTVSCMYDQEYFPFRIAIVSFAFLQYIIPSCVCIRINISLIMTLWTRTRRTIDVQRDNGIKATVRAARVRSIYTVVAVTFAFVTPYIFYVAYLMYRIVSQPKVDFVTDYVIRIVSVIIALTNSAMNVVIYFVQIKDFRTFLKTNLVKIFFTHSQPVQVEVELRPQGNP